MQQHAGYHSKLLLKTVTVCHTGLIPVRNEWIDCARGGRHSTSPEFVDQLLGPGVAGVFVVVLAVAVVLLLVVDD